MFVQTETTPNPNSLKFVPGKIVSNNGSFEVNKKDETNNELVKNLSNLENMWSVSPGTILFWIWTLWINLSAVSDLLYLSRLKNDNRKDWMQHSICMKPGTLGSPGKWVGK